MDYFLYCLLSSGLCIHLFHDYRKGTKYNADKNHQSDFMEDKTKHPKRHIAFKNNLIKDNSNNPKKKDTNEFMYETNPQTWKNEFMII